MTFQDQTLELAERHLVGRALVDERYLHSLLSALRVGDDGLPDLRSRDAEVLRRILYVLAAWSAEGTYDRGDNEARLIRYGSALGMADGFADYLDELYSPLMALETYQAELLTRVLNAYNLQDYAVESIRAVLTESPFPIGSSLEDGVYQRLRELVSDKPLRPTIPPAQSRRPERQVAPQPAEANHDVRFRFD